MIASFITSCMIAGCGVLPNGVASGDIDHETAVLWARSTARGDVTFEVAADVAFGDIVVVATAVVEDAMVPVKIGVIGLTPGTQYYYRATDATGDRAAGSFRTPHDSGLAGVRFGVSGDWRGELRPYPAVANVPERDLDVFVALGDTIYADFPSPAVPAAQAATLAEFRAKHAEVYGARFGIASLAEVRAASGTLVTIDDHEVTNDFAGGADPASDGRFMGPVPFINETALFRDGLQAFQEYNPVEDLFYDDTGVAVTAGKRKLYRYRVYGQDAALFILDARSFRDEGIQSLTPGSIDIDVDAFLEASFDETRTMLGAAQINELQRDLLDARRRGVTWKCIFVPEPIQNFGPFLAEDRFEGYAAERSRLLRFIDVNDIRNVVFIAADIHGTVINNLDYRPGPGEASIPTTAFEVTTGSVAFAPPFAPTLVQFADLANLGLVGDLGIGLYNAVSRPIKEALVILGGNVLLDQFGYNHIGLSDAPIDARLEIGDWVAVHTYGWTEFDIAADTQVLTVSTYGIPWYDAADLETDAPGVIRRRPRVVSRVVVNPDCAGLACADLPPPTAPMACGALGPAMLLLMMVGCVAVRSSADNVVRVRILRQTRAGRCSSRADAVS